MAFIHVSHWPHTLQCLPRNSLPTCIENRLKRLPERGPASLLDSNVCCDVCCSFRTTLVRSLARFQSLLRLTACRDVPSATRFLRTDLYVEIWLCLHFEMFFLGLARFVSTNFTILLRFKSNWAEPSAACFCTTHPCRINSQVE